jgi:hypothetical protein
MEKDEQQELSDHNITAVVNWGDEDNDAGTRYNGENES